MCAAQFIKISGGGIAHAFFFRLLRGKDFLRGEFFDDIGKAVCGMFTGKIQRGIAVFVFHVGAFAARQQ